MITVWGGQTSRSIRVVWLLEEMGLPYRVRQVDMLASEPDTGTFCHGDSPTMADICLVPQVYNARRWNVDISGLKRLLEISARCEGLEAFAKAHPDRAKG